MLPFCRCVYDCGLDWPVFDLVRVRPDRYEDGVKDRDGGPTGDICEKLGCDPSSRRGLMDFDKCGDDTSVGGFSTGNANAPLVKACNLSSRSLMYHRQFSPDQLHNMRCVSSDAANLLLRLSRRLPLCDGFFDASVMRSFISLLPFTMTHEICPLSTSNE